MPDNRNQPWSSMKRGPQETGRSEEENATIPPHLHVPSMDFDSIHARNHSASLRSPFGTPDLAPSTEVDQNAVVMFPDFTQTDQSVYIPRKKPLGMQPTRSIDTLDNKPPFDLLGDPGPIAAQPMLTVPPTNQYSTGLTPLLQSSPFFPPNSFGSELSTVKEEQNEFPAPSVESPDLRVEADNNEAIVFDNTVKDQIETECGPMCDLKRLAIQVDNHSLASSEPPAKRRNLAAGAAPIASPQPDNYGNNDDGLFDMPPEEDYDDPMIAVMRWAREDEAEIMKLFEEAEKVKWNYMSDQLFTAIEKRVPPSACHRKFLDLFGVSENTTILGSSLNYVAYRDGWKVIKSAEGELPN